MRTYLYLLLALFVTVPFVVHGAPNNSFAPLLPDLPGIKEFATSGSIPMLLDNIYKICIGVAATLAVLQIMRAGVLYMGGDSVTEKKEAKDLIAMSLTGLLLVLSPVILFSIINPSILSLQIGADRLLPAAGGQQAPGGSTSNSAAANQVASAVCSVAYTEPKIVPGVSANICSTVGSGYTGAPNACCKGLSTGSTCCAKQASSAAGSFVQATTNAINIMLAGCGISLTDQQKGCVATQTSFVSQGFSSCTENAQTCAASVGKSLLDACVPQVTNAQRICVYTAFAKASASK